MATVVLNPNEVAREARTVAELQMLLGLEIMTGRRQITAQNVFDYAALTWDRNPIHLDPDAAAQSIFKKRVVHGMLVAAIAQGLAQSEGLLQHLELILCEARMAWPRPVLFGDSLYVKIAPAQLLEPTRRQPNHQALFRINVYNQHDKLVHKAEWSLIVIEK